MKKYPGAKTKTGQARMLPILGQALDDLGFLPERDPQKFKQTEKDRKDTADSIIDGTKRRRQSVIVQVFG